MLEGMGAKASKGMSILRLTKFASVSQFQSGLRDIADSLLGGDNRGMFATPEHDSIAAGLDHGYRQNPEWFEKLLRGPVSPFWGPPDMGMLCTQATADSPECPMSILFGVQPDVVAGCHVQSFGQVAGLARLAVGEVDASLLATPSAFYDARLAPYWLLEEGGDRFAAHRLEEAFSMHSPLAELFDCSDAEKFRTFAAVMGRRFASSSELAALCVRAERVGAPLHRVLQAFARTGDVEASLVLWDAPVEYLDAAVGGGNE